MESELTKTEGIIRKVWTRYLDAKDMARNYYLEPLLDTHSALKSLAKTERFDFASVEQKV